jgi:hypothetical protein
MLLEDDLSENRQPPFWDNAPSLPYKTGMDRQL